MEPRHVKEAQDIDGAIQALMEGLEEEAGSKVFAWRTKDIGKNKLGLLVVFEDKSILEGILKVDLMQGKPSIRLQGNYI